jgi:Fe-S-cluster containining protein
MEEVFSCKRCGFCCHGESTVSLDPDDQENMLEVLKISREVALEKYWKINGNEIQMNTIDGHCIFYDDGCSVHEGRPWRCRQWPLVPAILLDINNLETIGASCPGIEKTAPYSDICNKIQKG